MDGAPRRRAPDAALRHPRCTPGRHGEARGARGGAAGGAGLRPRGPDRMAAAGVRAAQGRLGGPPRLAHPHRGPARGRRSADLAREPGLRPRRLRGGRLGRPRLLPGGRPVDRGRHRCRHPPHPGRPARRRLRPAAARVPAGQRHGAGAGAGRGLRAADAVPARELRAHRGRRPHRHPSRLLSAEPVLPGHRLLSRLQHEQHLDGPRAPGRRRARHPRRDRHRGPRDGPGPPCRPGDPARRRRPGRATCA